MTRTIDQDHRTALASAAADHFVASGNARASLRELAADVGASARMLVHHFGAREQLVEAALEIARERQLRAASLALDARGDALASLAAAWAWFRRKDTRRYFVLFADVAAQERPVPVRERRFTQRLGAEWLPLFESIFRADRRFAREAKTLALLVVGVLRGFALDLNDGARGSEHERSFQSLVEMIAARGSEA